MTGFSDQGEPAGAASGRAHFPGLNVDDRAIAFDIVDHSLAPTYRLGDRLIVSPEAEMQMGDRVIAMGADHKLIVGELGRRAERHIEIRPLADGSKALILSKNELTWIARILWVSQ